MICLILAVFRLDAAAMMVIDVEAGDATTICYGETLDITGLGATISGDVSDGLWFTTGDGIFLPSQQSNGIFSTTTQYQPGPQDMANGSFNLILVSDDPDGNGPMVEVSDDVTISFMSAPALVCNSSINVSLAENCNQEVNIFMLLANPTEPYDKYTIALHDENGDIITGNILEVEHLGMDISFTVGHDCTSNSCDGMITVSDNIPPFLNCTDVEIDCGEGTEPSTTGFPIPFYADAVSNGPTSYIVTNFDACGDVTLTYNDIELEQNCASGFITRINRLWHAEDEAGNESTCEQVIMVRPLSLDSVVAPPNYDDISNPPLSCSGNWIPLPNGYPSPVSTGSPSFSACSNINVSYTDVEFELCGGGYKILRQWFVLDWCTTNDLNFNQTIKVADTLGPIFTCPDTLTLSTKGYTCESIRYAFEPTDTVIDCSDYHFGLHLMDLDSNDITAPFIDSIYLENVPVGEYLLTYIGIDECGNTDSCTNLLIVEDNAAPFAICEGFTKVSVTNNGYADIFATTLDDSSFDNCGIVDMEVAKMDDKCGWGLSFGDKVRFCCEEVGDTVMVAFRVTDEAGNSNICMTSVLIEDKLAPMISCPSNVTISCDDFYDINDLSPFGTMIEADDNNSPIIINGQIVGQNGYYNDNCNATLSEIINENINCGIGTITRTFTVVDDYGQSESCSQRITIENNDPFTVNDIQWPSNYESTGCDTLQAETDVTGAPSFIDNDACAQVAATYTDQVFFISGEACVKILRTWTVIDWCQFEQNNGDGLWTYLQEIKLKNNIAPIFESCENQEICSYDADCTSELVTLSAPATDDCTDSLYINYLWSIDVDDDGSIDFSGSGISLQREFTYGNHRIFWTAEDGCGNTSDCDYTINVKDCKNPTPVCQPSITTTVMPSSGSIQIWAEDYNFGSYDNCTASEDLIYSFEQDITQTSKTITCDDIENGIAAELTFELWVTDEAGNQERCFVTLIIQDNGDYCEDGTIKGRISGKIETQNGVTIPNAGMDYSCILESYSGFEVTDEEGKYKVEEAPEYLTYVMKPAYATPAIKGVSTIDLIRVQRHILELAPLDNPYDLIASDVSGNKRITGSDLTIMRKMILGVIVEWPNDVTPWTFVDSAYIFPDEEDPFEYPDTIVLSKLQDSVDHVNFVAIKIGDINGSFVPEGAKATSSSASRSLFSTILIGNASFIENNQKISYSLDTEGETDGFQLSIELPEGASFAPKLISEDDYHILNNEVRISWTYPMGMDIDGVPLFEIQCDKNQSAPRLLDNLDSEVYYETDISDLEMRNTTEESERAEIPFILGNPFQDYIRIYHPTSFDGHIEVISNDGNVMYSQVRNANEREILKIDSGDYPTGIYYIVLRSDEGIETLKAVKID